MAQKNLPARRSNPATVSPSALLERVVEFYHKTFLHSREAIDYMRTKGLDNASLQERHQLGYVDGKLQDVLPRDEEVKRTLRELGVLDIDGTERFTLRIVAPVFDAEGEVVDLCGWRVAHNGQVSLPSPRTGIWNIASAKVHPEIILTDTVLDALSLLHAGCPNVCAAFNGPVLAEDVRLLGELGVNRIVLAVNDRLIPDFKTSLAGLDCIIKSFPGKDTPQTFLARVGPDKLAEFMATGRLRTVGDRAGPDGLEHVEGGFITAIGERQYELRGIEKAFRKLKVVLRTERAGKLYVDTVDLYSARARKGLCHDLSRLFDKPPEIIDMDITRLLRQCEQYQPATDESRQPLDPALRMSAQEREEAEELGRSADLVDRILTDYEACGLVGEDANKLLCYLAAVSRKMPEPLSILILSGSGAGKTALQDTTLLLGPPEDIVKLTSVSGKALFYKERDSLKHKILALEEAVGAENAQYAVRNLISARELVIEATVKDPGTGKMTTMENRVAGPTSVFITTTDPDTDPETRSRFFVTGIDESPEQTVAILESQRRRQTLAGLYSDMDTAAVIARHRNFQRLLKPLAVVNPYAEQLTFGDDRLQGRRDQPKYLNLIKAVAFLRQMSKPVKHAKRNGCLAEHIEVDIEDVRIANNLAVEILGRSLDELSRPGRQLLMLLDEMVEKQAGLMADGVEKPPRTDVMFSRRDIREYTGWTNTRLHNHLAELVDLEYVIVAAGRNGSRHHCRLAYEGQGKQGGRFMLGLTSVEDLNR